MSEYLTSCIMFGIYQVFDFRSITTSMSFFTHTKNAVWISVKSTEYLQLWSSALSFLIVIFIPLFLLSIWRLSFLWLFSHSVMSTSCDPIDCSTPGFPVHHQFPKLAQTHVHWVGDAIQPSYPLLSPSSPAFNLSQHHGLFQWVGSQHQVF